MDINEKKGPWQSLTWHELSCTHCEAEAVKEHNISSVLYTHGADGNLSTCFIWKKELIPQIFYCQTAVSALIWTFRLRKGEFIFPRLLPWSPRGTGRWYASCYLLHTWLQVRGEWSWNWSWNRVPLRDSSRAVAPKSLFDNLFVLDECSSFIFTFWRLSVEN